MPVVANISLNTAQLDVIRQQLSAGRKSFAKVGIMADHASRADGLTNPQVGIIQEKGSMTSKPPIPRRSFLEDPLVEQLPKHIVQVTPAVWMETIRTKGILAALKILGGMGENIVRGAFGTAGYGKWAPNAPMTIARKGSSQPLIDTGELRKSISSEVVSA